MPKAKKHSMPSERLNFGKIKQVISMPNLIDMQVKSYAEFLQREVLPEARENKGLHAVFQEVFPIKSYDETLTLEFLNCTLGVPKYEIMECLRRGLTYSVPLNVNFRLVEEGTMKEETVYMGNIPLMTENGTFIINGAERVIVSQLHRSPGICFEKDLHPGGTTLFSSRIIPYRGSWLEAQFDINDVIYVYLDRMRRRRKILATTFIRALGYSKDEDILKEFYEFETININKKIDEASIEGRVLAKPVVDNEGTLVEKAAMPVSLALIEKLKLLGIKEIIVLIGTEIDDCIVRMIQKETADSMDAALKEIYKKLRPGDPPTVPNARALLKRLFFDVRRYDLGRVGRYKINLKSNFPLTPEELSVTTLKKTDIVGAIKHLLKVRNGVEKTDDIDHLGNRRVRSVGELLQNQCRIGLSRMERIIKERMNLYDVSLEGLTPHKLINPKGLSSVIRDFFGRSQLSQFMDQTNPLAELTHKRRLSALGPGGLSRERAGFEVRDVHPSHYGRICPVETPEGPNIGLISSMSTFSKINDYGFIETPYRKATKGRVTETVEYITADKEEKYIIAQANAPLDDKGFFKADLISVRHGGEFRKVPPAEVTHMDVSPMQLVSVAAGLIPFLEHDDANRALMGSNMQRQAVPLLTTESPLVATGLEKRAAEDSGVVILAEEDGIVSLADADKIEIGLKQYILKKYIRSNAGTSINQKPLVRRGDQVKKGDVIADGMATKDGELALGRNVLVAFMPWEGYNFEDAILISQGIVKEDKYTSIHVEEFEIGARDTKLGKEEITKDIPNVGEDALRNLGEDGIIRLGAEVRPGDILVGKITPKSETELTPEERLLRAIFGEKAADVRDASLKVPSGTGGIVIDVKTFSRKDRAKSDEERAEERTKLKEINENYKNKCEVIDKDIFSRIRELILGEKLDLDIINTVTGEIFIPAGTKLSKSVLEKMEVIRYENLEMGESAQRESIRKILWEYRYKLESIQSAHALDIEKLRKGDELEPGVIKKVKVYIATKRKLAVGDKMAGRHGNKGVIAKIVPEEDMPFLEDGTPVEMVLNPLGVPSRMNVGQVLETHLGWAAKALGLKVQTPVFDGINGDEVRDLMGKAKLPVDGKAILKDGRTGEAFDQRIVVGYLYMLKLAHLAADKIHARATGPYSLVTQQPLGGKAQFGGQRFGEMEVWALESYGAAYTLQEILTVKSDDVVGRTKMYESIVKGDNISEAGTPESFNVLIKEIQSLALDIRPE